MTVNYVKPSNGICEAWLSSWTKFNEVVHNLLDLPYYIFRGHRCRNWLLEPTLTRLIKNRGNADDIRKHHLKEFKYSIRGRRGPNPPSISSDNDWWALGQHHGLATPLLDWSVSPYVGLFFSFSETDPATDTDYRIVYALNTHRVEEESHNLLAINPSSHIIEFVRPLSDENSRLVNQAGLFTLSPEIFDIESWVSANFSKLHNNNVVLLKIFVPNADRIECLKALNRMNINHSTLFPDLHGGARFSNMRLEIDNY